MTVHEGLLENNSVRIYLGQVKKVARSEEPPVYDFINNELSPMEIIFNVGNILTEARAIPLDQTNEVVEGDFVIIFSMEHIYNSTYYYHSIRKMDRNNDSIYMRYGNSEIRLIPKTSDNTDLIIAGGKSIIGIDTTTKRINIESDSGGINLNSHQGLINISNDETSLKNILQELIKTLLKLKVMTTNGPAPITANTSKKLLKLAIEIPKLLTNTKSSSMYPNLPGDTYTVEFAAEAVGSLGIHFLNDHGDPTPGLSITNLQAMFGEDPDRATLDNPILGTAVPEGLEVDKGTVDEEDFSECGTDYQLSPNFKLSDVSTKATFPHKVKSQHGLDCEDIVKNLKVVALNILEPLYAKYPSMKIRSGFRGTPSLSGGRISQHEIGEAVDIQFPGFTPQQYFEASQWVVENIPFHQFIFEHGKSIWFHISCKREERNTGQLLTMLRGQYSPGITLHYS